jgi:hypothetical protein
VPVVGSGEVEGFEAYGGGGGGEGTVEGGEGKAAAGGAFEIGGAVEGEGVAFGVAGGGGPDVLAGFVVECDGEVLQEGEEGCAALGFQFGFRHGSRQIQ